MLLKYTSRDTSNATEMNKHERNIEIMYAVIRLKLRRLPVYLLIGLGWLVLYAASWLVGLGLGFILFY